MMQAQLNGTATAQVVVPPSMPVVSNPTLTLHMEGYARLQMPASPEAQAIFDLLAPEVKQNPGKHAFIAEEAGKAAEAAIPMFSHFMQSSPHLRPTTGKLAPSFGVVDGKLFYVLMLTLKTA